MKCFYNLLAAVLIVAPMSAQTWQSIAPTGSPQPYYTVWTKAVYDYGHKQLLLTQDDSGHGSGIYADTVFAFNPTNGAWTQLWVSDAAASQCPGNTASRPNHRHTYNQITWDTLRNQMYITSGSCQGALSYDWYAFTHSGTLNSGSWTQSSNNGTNPGNRQEGAMVYMANVDRVLLYGGFAGASASTSDDTWEYNPNTNTWTQICTGCAPGVRHAHILVYDDASGKVILFGGQRSFGGANIAQTYIYDPTQPVSTRWKAANPVSEAPASAYTCHGYDKQRSRLLIYPTVGHVYSYTVAGNTWSDLGITGGPNPDPGAGDGTADTFCGFDYDHDWFVFFAYPGVGGGPAKTFGLDFGNPIGGTTDITPPAVAMSAPANNSTVSGTVTVSANASDNVGVVGVQFQLDGANLGAELTTPPYNVSWNTTTASNATHSLTAIARDAAGNRTTAAAVSVTVNNTVVDTTPPTVALTAPAANATVSATITVSANASDNVGVAGVQFQLDGANLGAEDTTSPYSVSWNTTTASNAAHTLTAIARDAAGNRTTSSAVVVTVSNQDTTPPTVALTAPAANATVSATITVSANASDNVGVAGVQFQLDGANLGAEDITSPYSISWNTTTASNAAHTLTAIARDAAGNRTTSSAVVVTVNNPVQDTTPPTISFTAPAANATVNGTITVSATASDNVGVVGVQFQLDGANLGAEDTVAPYSISWDTTAATNATHTLTATARDAAGNKTTATVSVIVGNITITAGGVGTDANTKYVVDVGTLSSMIACSSCWFSKSTDVVAGQTLEIRVRPGTNPAVADQVILKEGALDGTVTSTSTNQFVLQTPAGGIWPASVTVQTGNVTQFLGFATATGPVQTGQKLSVRGLLFKSTPQGILLVAESIQLRP